MNTIFFSREFVAALTLACLLPLSMSASAQTPPNELKNAPAAGQRGGSDGGRRTLIATVFGASADELPNGIYSVADKDADSGTTVTRADTPGLTQ